ncbi:MAG: hypothetical protein LBI20_04105 [Holosporales bacterium]|jgi:hypothetical protein|nr:hypothetical protein [Holosporales bacterium]
MKNLIVSFLTKSLAIFCLSIFLCKADDGVSVAYIIGSEDIDPVLGQRWYNINSSLPEATPIDSLLFSSTYTDSRVVMIPNGSVLNFAASGVCGTGIRIASTMNRVPNPLFLSHSGLVINDNPAAIYGILCGLRDESESTISRDYQPQRAALDLMISNLTSEFNHVLGFADGGSDYVASFCLEANGSVAQVCRGILPHVQIRSLPTVVHEYRGNVFVRPLFISATTTSTQDFLRENIGRPYEGVGTIKEMVLASSGANSQEETRRVFCSELVSLFHRNCGNLRIDNVSNVIPERLGFGAEEYDLLRSIAREEIPLKLLYNFGSIEEVCCCSKGKGCLML